MGRRTIKRKKPLDFKYIRVFVAFLFVINFSCLSHSQSEKNYQIESIAALKIPLNKQLSQGRVSDMIEDDRGFVWIGTMDGLNRYDGYDVKVFRQKFDDTTSLDNSQIVKILNGRNGVLWVLTKTGINQFDSYTEKSKVLEFPRLSQTHISINDIVLDTEDKLWIGSDSGLFVHALDSHTIEKVRLDSLDFIVMRLMVDQENKIWIGGKSNKLIKYNPENGKQEVFFLPDFPLGNEDFDIVDIHEDKEGNVWVADNNPFYPGLELPNVFVNKKEFSDFKSFTEYNELLRANDKLAFISQVRQFESKANQLWMVTTTQGVGSIDFSSQTFTSYPEYREFIWHRELDMTTLLFDSRGDLWMGTNGKGAYILPAKKELFKLVNIKIEKEFDLKSVRAFYESDQYFWVGGYNGLIKMKKSNQKIFPLVTRDIVYCISESLTNEQEILLGTEGGGLLTLDEETGRLENVTYEWIKDEETKNYWHWIFDIFTEGDSLYWCGARNGIIKYNIRNKQVSLYENEGYRNFDFGNILVLYRDFQQQLFAGSDVSGLLIYDKDLDDFKPYENKKFPAFDFRSLRVNHITQTSDSTYWISTDKGLLQMNDNELQFITKEEGMLNDFVYAAIPDQNNHLWMSTNAGICRFNIADRNISTFSTNDGLQGMEFNTAAHFKSQDGCIYFGGVNGYNYFNPSHIHQQHDEFPTVITGIYFNNTEHKLPFSTSSLLSFKIPPQVDYFKLEFASLNYVSAPQNRYKYKIDEIHHEWIHLGHENEIGFHSMDHGVYNLQIWASDHHGNWNSQPLKIKFEVEAMYWETQWFRYGLVVLILILVFFINFYRIKLLKRQKREIEAIVKERTKELSSVNKELRNANKTKEKFLTIISHDIKNPLGAAQSVSADLMDHIHDYSDDERNTLLGVMHRSLDYMNDLITNLRSWSKLQHQEIKAQFNICDLEDIVQDNVKLVAASLVNKELVIETHIQNGVKLYADCKMIETIIRNLLSNAIKFSYPKSSIHIYVKEEDKQVKIIVKDNGVGMSKKVKEALFSSDRSQSLPGTSNEKGTGFGLLMIHEFVKLNKGKIDVESKEGEGSTFILTFPA